MLVNKKLANKEVATEYGMIKFNSKGESKDLTAEQEQEFAHLRGFSVVVEKKEEVKEEVKEEEVKEDKKDEKGKGKGRKKKSEEK